MKLKEYIQLVGTQTAATVFGVPVRRIQSWSGGHRRPRPEMALKIERLTKGRVTYREIYESQEQAK